MASPETPLLTRVVLAENWPAGWLMLSAAGRLIVPSGATDDLCGKNGWAGRRRAMRRIVEGLPPNTDLRRAAMLLAANPADPADCAEIAEMLAAELPKHSLAEAADAARSWRRLADGYGDRGQEDPIRASRSAAHFLPSPQPENGEVSTDNTAPSPAELSEAPILDDWEWVGTDLQWRVRGIVSGSAKFVAGSAITTSAVSRTNWNRTWVRTRNSLYLMGYRSATRPPIVRAAVKNTWHDAFNLLVGLTGTHTLTAELNIALQVAELDWPSRHGTARLIADETYLAGRNALGSAWLLLAAGDLHGRRIAHGEIAQHASGGKLPDLDAVIVGWKMLAEGLNLGEDITDPVAAAHRIGDRHTRNDSLLDNPLNDKKDNRTPEIGVMVISKIGGTSAPTVKSEFKDMIGHRVAVVPLPDIAKVRAELAEEFPHAVSLIDRMLSDLPGRPHVKFAVTLLVGPPGCGKSRLGRRIGEACGLYVHGFDGAGPDAAYGGTARRWNTGEPAWPLIGIRDAKSATILCLVDEIDKGGISQINGSLVKTILPLLEPETSGRFMDPYLQSAVDLSNVSYVLTANDDKDLPKTLRDRCRILRMPPISAEHVGAICIRIVRDIATERGLGPGWFPGLDGDEIEIAQRLLGDGSIRRLRMIVERLLAARETNAARN